MEVPRELGMDAFQYCMEGGEENVKPLSALDPLVIASRVGPTDVNDTAMGRARPQVCIIA